MDFRDTAPLTSIIVNSIYLYNNFLLRDLPVISLLTLSSIAIAGG